MGGALPRPRARAIARGSPDRFSGGSALVLDPEQAREGIREGLRRAGKWGELRRESEGDPEKEASLLSSAYFAAGPGRGKLYLCTDGTFRTGWRRIRDAQGRPHQKKLVGESDPAAPGFVADQNLSSRAARKVSEYPLSDLVQGDDQEALIAMDVLQRLRVADEAVEAVVSAEAYDAVQAVAAELLQEDPRPVERLLLGRAWDLINETTSPTELARCWGRPERTVRAAWGRVLARMSAHPRMRGFLRSA